MPEIKLIPAVCLVDADGRVLLSQRPEGKVMACLLYTSDAADDSLRVYLGGRRIIKKWDIEG